MMTQLAEKARKNDMQQENPEHGGQDKSWSFNDARKQ